MDSSKPITKTPAKPSIDVRLIDVRLIDVLLIEDNPEQMVLVQTNLDVFGEGRYRLEWASRLIDGMEQLGKAHFDVVLLDLGLPECKGSDSYLAVRKKSPDVPVLILTADHREDTVKEVIGAGAQGYLIKEELSPLRLVDAIQRVLARHNRSETLEFGSTGWRWQQNSSPALRQRRYRTLSATAD